VIGYPLGGEGISITAGVASSHVTRHTSHATRHTSHVTRHTSHRTKEHVTRHTSHVTRHSSHVTRHTSHVTRHTSHASGVVSRVDYGEYAQSKKSNLCVQVDAAINSGNSGGPAVSKGLCVGVAFQSLEEGDNIGYIVPLILQPKFSIKSRLLQVPSTILSRLIDDYESSLPPPPSPPPPHPQLRGFAEFPILTQPAENAALRAHVGTPDGVSGVIVRCVTTPPHN